MTVSFFRDPVDHKLIKQWFCCGIRWTLELLGIPTRYTKPLKCPVCGEEK